MARAGSVTTKGLCLSFPVIYDLLVGKMSFEDEHSICGFMPSFTATESLRMLSEPYGAYKTCSGRARLNWWTNPVSTTAKHFNRATYSGSALELHQVFFFYWSGYQQTCSKEAFRALHLVIHQHIEWFCKEGLRRRFFDSFLSPIPLLVGKLLLMRTFTYQHSSQWGLGR